MEKITLEPGVWTQVHASRLVQSKSNQSGLRIHYGEAAPEPDTNLYFFTAEFDLKPFRILDGPIFLYLMPDEDVSVDVVAF